MRIRAMVRRQWSGSSALLALTLLPLFTAVVHAWRAGWVPIGDHGLIELRAADVLTGDHPWLGTWTSASLSAGSELNNPGPLLFDVLAPFVKWIGGSIGAVIGVAFVNGAACAIALWHGRAVAGRGGEVLMAVACLLLSWSMGSEMLIDPWQPHVLLLPTLAFLAAAAASAAGDVRAVPWMVGLASLLVQSHLSFTFVVAMVGGAALFGCWRSLRSAAATGQSAPWRRSAVLSGIVALACWIQPLYEQVFGPGEGNLSRLAASGGGSSDTIGLRLGARLVGRVVALPPWFLRPSFGTSIPITPRSADGLLHAPTWPPLLVASLALAVVLTLALLLARRLRAVGAGGLAALLQTMVVAVVAALVTLVLLPLGPLGLAPHQMRWLWPISVLLWCAIAAALVVLVPAALWPVAQRRRLAAAGALLLAVANVPALLTDSGPATFRRYRPVLTSMIDQLDRVRLEEPAVFDTENLRFAEPFSGPALFVLLDNEQPLRLADEVFVRQLGEGRRAHGNERFTVQVLERDAALSIDPQAKVLAYADGLSGAQRDELTDLARSGADPARLAELVALRQSLVVAIVLIPRSPQEATA